MALPVPQPGQVIRYSYLWRHEFERGLEEGRKDRPCAILLAARFRENEWQVVVLPVTHSPPSDPALAVEIPAATKSRLGLDDQRSFIVVSEANRFIWPGPDLRPSPGQRPDSVLYGLLPRYLFLEVREKFLAASRSRNSALVPRTD